MDTTTQPDGWTADRLTYEDELEAFVAESDRQAGREVEE